MLRQLRRIPWPLLVSAAVLTLATTLLLTARTWVEWEWFTQFGWGSVIVRRWLLQGAGLVLGLSLGVGLQSWVGWLWARPVVGEGERSRFALAPFPYLLTLIALAAAQMLPLLLLLRLAQRLLLNPFDPHRLHGLVALADLSWPAVALLAPPVLLVLLRAPQRAPRLLSALASAFAAVALARGWGFWCLALMAPDTGVSEPMLGADVSFALVRFPALAFGLTLALSLGCVHMAAALWGLMARPPSSATAASAASVLPSCRPCACRGVCSPWPWRAVSGSAVISCCSAAWGVCRGPAGLTCMCPCRCARSPPCLL